MARSGSICFASNGGVFLREQRLHRDVGNELRIADVRVAVGERELQRLGDRMQVRRAVPPHALQVVPLEDVERLEHDEPLRVRRAFVDVGAAVVDVDRRVLERLHAREIRFCDDPAVCFQERGGVLRDVALVERVRPLRRDCAQRARQIRVADDVAHRERLAVLEIDLRRRRILRDLRARALDPVGQRFGHGEAAVGDFDRRCENVREWLRAVRFHGIRRTAHRRRHGDRQRPLVGNAALRLVEVDRGRLRGDAGAVDELHLTGLGVVIQDEHVGAEAGHARLDFALHRPRRDGGVHRVAAGLEYPHPGFGGERMSGRHHPVLRDDRRPPAAAGRLRIVLRLWPAQRADEDSESGERLSPCHGASPTSSSTCR